MCPTKQLVKQLEEPQPKPQVEQEKTPQEQIKINHEDGDLIKKKKTRRGGKARHPMQTQDAKMMSKNEDEKKIYAHIKCFKCGSVEHLPLSVLLSLRRRLKQSMRGKAMRSTT